MGRGGQCIATETPWCFSYVWEHLDVGYVQGMCDLLAPLLVVLDNGEAGLVGLGLGRSKLGKGTGGWCGLHGLGGCEPALPPSLPASHPPPPQTSWPTAVSATS